MQGQGTSTEGSGAPRTADPGDARECLTSAACASRWGGSGWGGREGWGEHLPGICLRCMYWSGIMCTSLNVPTLPTETCALGAPRVGMSIIKAHTMGG